MKNKVITIVGVGALGSHLVQLLRNVIAVGQEVQLKVVDFDRVEHKNTRSQFHCKPQVGKLKIDAVKAAMSLLWGVTKIQTVPAKLAQSNLRQVLDGSDLLVDCLDNAEARTLVKAYALYKDVPCLHGALAADGAFGRVVWDPDFKIDSEDVAGQATCDEGDHLPFIALVSSYLACAVSEWVRTGKKTSYSISPRNAFAH
jgi:molybdopterin/thiamine biosynthesis adenylyltransferase